MKTGRCPTCGWRLVVVNAYRCGCGCGHRNIAARGGCDVPRTEHIVRTHSCGSGLKPVDVRELP